MATNKYSDEDNQAFTMQQIIDMLVAGGYFRARVSGLDAFDKIVGGFSWAITSSGIPIDVDVDFQENANIGEKILISENIVAALLEMKCPFRLKPHQIQGLKLNCIPLFPITQWLVKSVIDYRRITGNTTRNYSTFLFNSSTSSFIDNYLDINTSIFGKNYLINDVNNDYLLKRKYSKQINTSFNSAENYVDATLLEYGFNFRAHIAFGQSDVGVGDGTGDNDNKSNNQYPDLVGSSSTPKKGKSSKLSAKYSGIMKKIGGDQSNNQSKKPKKSSKNQKKNDADIDDDDNIETAEETEKRLKSIRNKMMQQDNIDGKTNVSGSALVGIIDRDAVQVGKGNYNENDVKEQALLLKKNDKEFVYNQRKKNLETRYKQLAKAKKLKIELYKKENAKAEQLQKKIELVAAKNDKIKEMIQALDIEENKIENKDILMSLKKLVTQNESIKQQIDQFKKDCISQSEMFIKKLNALDEIKDDDEELARIRKIEKLYKNDLKKYDKIRIILAEKNQEISRVSRKLESYPTRSELLQYEKRFVELYNLTNERLKETKKYYHLYNSLNDNNESMKNEVALLQKIKIEFPKRSKNENDRTDFIKSMNKMCKQLKTNNDNANNKLKIVKDDKDKQASKYNELLNYQRKYYKYVKEFQNACNINEQLSDRIESIEAQLKELNDA